MAISEPLTAYDENAVCMDGSPGVRSATLMKVAT